MGTRRERRRPTIVDRHDQYKSYVINFTIESKDALISMIESWLGFDSTHITVRFKHLRIFTIYTFTKPDFNTPFKMMVIHSSGLSFLQRQCRDYTTKEEIQRRLQLIFHNIVPNLYESFKYYLLDLAEFILMWRDKDPGVGRSSCILLRVDYFTYKEIFNYLTDVSLTRTDDSIIKFQLF